MQLIRPFVLQFAYSLLDPLPDFQPALIPSAGHFHIMQVSMIHSIFPMLIDQLLGGSVNVFFVWSHIKRIYFQ